MPLHGEGARELGAGLQKLGYLQGYDERAIEDALRRFSMTENLEERLRDDGRVYAAVLEYVSMKAGEA